MSGVDDVAAWIGVITGIGGVTLSVVAIWFAIAVERSSREVSNQTIKSLQKIETSVERQSSDTQNLVKAGWDRLLGSALTPTVSRTGDAQDVKALAAGIAAELRADLNVGDGEDVGSPGPPNADDRSTDSRVTASQEVTEAFEKAIQQFSALVETTALSGDSPRVLHSDVDRWVKVLEGLDPLALEMARALDIYGRHLELREYRSISANKATRSAVRELRMKGVLAPLSAHGDSQGPPVYWFPPHGSAPIRTAFSLLGRRYPEAFEEISKVLERAGYLRRDGDDYEVTDPHTPDPRA